MKQLIAGNWKMNGLRASMGEISALLDKLGGAAPEDREVLVCPPATLLAQISDRLAGTGLLTGGQTCHVAEAGAHTGEVSAEMIADAGATFVIVGHSERRADNGETDADVRAKALAAERAGLAPIVCVGETREEREAGRAGAVVTRQLQGSVPLDAPGLVVAYEPVWAIGTGLTASVDDIAQMHALIRQQIGRAKRILYGGSVKPGNAREILGVDDVDGALVGGASLKAADFAEIVAAARG